MGGRDDALGRVALEKGLITLEALEEALSEHGRTGRALAEILRAKGILSAETVRALEEEVRAASAATMTDAPPAKPAGSTPGRIGKYEVVGKLGKGGMGVVYRAWDPDRQGHVAIKCMLETEDAVDVQRFLREASTATQLSHPNIVSVYEIDEQEGMPYLVMELVEGESLARLLNPRKAGAKRIGMGEALRVVRDAARALHYAHERNIVHRDVKPENVMVDKAGVAKLMDFGLARELSHGGTLTSTGHVMGTPYYMSPEQAQGKKGKVDRRSDIWALGVMVYEIAAQRVPFEGETPAEVMHKIVNEEAEPLRRRSATVAADLETIAMKCLEPERERRYGTAEEVAADLDRYLAHQPIAARPPGVAYKLGKRLRKRKGLVAAVAGGVVAVAVVAAILVPRLGKAQAEAGTAREEAQRTRERDERRMEAMAILERARPALDKAARVLYDREAKYEHLVKRVEAAQGAIEEGIAKAPEVALGHYLMGLAWEIRGEEGKAEASFRAAIERDGRFGPARFQLGKLLLVRAYLATLAIPDNEELARSEIVNRMAEATRHLDAALSTGSGFDDAVQRTVAAALTAFVKRDADGLDRIVRDGLARLEGQDGLEDLHWVAAVGRMPADRLGPCARALSICPKHVLALFTRASAHLKLGDFARAIEDFDAVLAIRPTLALAYQERGVARRQSGDVERAIADFGEALRIDPATFGAWTNRAVARIQKGDYAGAEQDATESIRRYPRLSESFVNRCSARARLGDLRGALADGEEAVRLNPRNAPAHVNLAAVRDKLGDPAGARAALDEAVRIQPLLFEAWFSRAVIRDKMADRTGALEDCKRAQELNPLDPDARRLRAVLHHKLGQLEEAIAAYRALLEVRPGMKDLEETIVGLEKERAGKPPVYTMRTLEEYDEYIRKNPTDAKAYVARGALRSKSGDTAGAVADFEKARELDPTLHTAWYNLGNQKSRAGKLDEAIADFTRALELKPGYVYALWGRARARTRKNDLEGALADYNEALRHEPNHLDVLITRGELRYNMGDVKGALEDHRRALEAAPATWPKRDACKRVIADLEKELGK